MTGILPPHTKLLQLWSLNRVEPVTSEKRYGTSEQTQATTEQTAASPNGGQVGPGLYFQQSPNPVIVIFIGLYLIITKIQKTESSGP